VRLALVTWIFPPDIGGPASHAADVRQELIQRGHQVVVITLGDGNEIRQVDGVVRYPRAWPLAMRLAAVAVWLARHRQRYDLVYASGMHEAAVAGARLGGRPAVLRVVSDHVWERARRLGLTGKDFPAFQVRGDSSFRIGAMRWARDWALQHAQAVVTPSQHLAAAASRWVRGRAPLLVVPNGVRPQEQRSAAFVGERPDADLLRAVAVGHLVPQKRVGLIIEAAARVPTTLLRVIGEGPDRGRLEARARDLRVADRISFLGRLDRADVLRELGAADVLVMASEHEGLPHAAIEALASGTPVVALAVGGLPELVTDGANGILVDAGTPSALGEALARMASDPNLLEKLRGSARRDASRWSLERCVDRLEDVFLRALQERGS
jgi:glycosyltransferase involved in cell wall biosynthesis